MMDARALRDDAVADTHNDLTLLVDHFGRRADRRHFGKLWLPQLRHRGCTEPDVTKTLGYNVLGVSRDMMGRTVETGPVEGFYCESDDPYTSQLVGPTLKYGAVAMSGVPFGVEAIRARRRLITRARGTRR